MRPGEFKLSDDKVLTKRQVGAILWGAYKMKSGGVGDFAPQAFDAFLLMYVLGLRLGEVIRLRYANVGARDSAGKIRSVRVPTEKKLRYVAGKRVQIDPLDALYEVPVLAHHDWIAKAFDPRTRVGKAAVSAWLFPSPRTPDRHVSDRLVDYAFREARGRGGVADVYSSHALRHTAATEIARTLARRGHGENEVEAWVGKFLRHSDAAVMKGAKVTRLYIHLGPRGVADWAPLAGSQALTLPTPLAPVGPSRFDPEKRFGG